MMQLWLRYIALMAAAALMVPPPASAQEARLKNITLRRSGSELVVSFDVEGAFSQKVTEAVLRGVPAEFSFLVSLNRSRRMWFDKELASIEIGNQIKYDNLKKEFIITRPWMGEPPTVTGSYAEAQKFMTEIRDLPVIDLNRLEAGSKYELWAKAELRKMTLPFYLHYVFYFVTLWDFETDWYTLDFVF